MSRLLPRGRRLQLGRPLLAGPARRWAALLLAGCAVAAGLLGVAVAHQSRAGRLDHAVDSAVISGIGGQRTLLEWLVFPGSLFPAVALSAAIAVGCLLAGRLNGAVLAAAAVPAATGLDEGLLKPLVGRTYLGSLSYPSGHTTAVTALAMTATVLWLASPWPPRLTRPRAVILAAAWLMVAVVAVCLVGLRWHYGSDTVGGAAVGIGTVCGLALILDLPTARRLAARLTRDQEGSGAANKPAAVPGP